MPQNANIRCYFDFISPYAYLGWMKIQKLQESHSVQLEAQPVLFAAFLNHHGHKGPAEIPPKRLFVGKDVFRRCVKAKLPIQLPASHPFNPLLALRLVESYKNSEKQHELISTIFLACWGHGRDITKPEVLHSILEEMGEENPSEKLAQAATDENKESLKQAVEQAVQAGVFGVPAFLIDKELFWGQDQNGFIIDYIEGKDPAARLTKTALDKLPSSAQRKS